MTEDVYSPRDDSFLLAEEALNHCGYGDCVVDVGCGSGFVADRVQSETDASVVGTDISRAAAVETRNRGVQSVVGDMLRHFEDDSLDVVLFNPPYIQSDDPVDEFDRRSLSYQSIDFFADFLTQASRTLRNDGICLLLLSSRTDVDSVENIGVEVGFDIDTVASENQFYETLYVKRFRI